MKTMILKVRCRLMFMCLILLSMTVQAGQENIRFQRIALEQGLSQETVISAYQDKEGFMWFGTQEGLNRFDGYHFKVFTHSARQPHSLASDWVYTINEAPNGDLWVGTLNGISVFDKSTERFTHHTHDANNPNTISDNVVRVIFKDSQGILWIGTDKGLDRFNEETNDFTRYELGVDRDVNSIRVNAIVEDIAGFLWVGTGKGGLYRFDTSKESLALVPSKLAELTGFENTRVRSLLIDAQQRLWVGTYEEGVSVIELGSQPSNDKTYGIWQPSEFNDTVVNHIYEDNNKAIWLATQNGLYQWRPENEAFDLIQHEIDNIYSLSTNRVNYLYQDRGGVFWVATFSGLNKWNTATAKFDHIRVNTNKSQSLSNSNTNTFFDAGNNSMWIATWEGLNLLDTETGNIDYFLHDENNENSIRSNKVMTLFARSSDELFVGYLDRGLSYLDRKTGQYTHYQADAKSADALSANGVTSIEPGHSGKLWISTYGGGLNLFDPSLGSFKRYMRDENDPRSISSNRILSMEKDSSGLLWLGTWDAGLSIFNPTTEAAMTIAHDSSDPDSLGSNVIYAVYEDRGGNIWLGTQGSGLNKLSAENRIKGVYKFEKITRYEGLPSNTVYGIVEDEQGKLWLSTNRGVSKFNPSDNSLLNYDSSHGLQGNEFNVGAYYRAPNGKVYFGGTNGATAFFPEDISPNSHVPPVVLTKFQKLHEVITLDSSESQNSRIHISYKDYLIAFEFAGLDFASPSNNLYLYKLEGFDSDWIKADDIRRATYTNLPAGNYVFRVKASNNDGVWNEQGAAIALTVAPAPWASWWAYLIYFATAILAIYWLYRSYLNKLEKEAKYRNELEQEVKSRTVELRRVNEQLLSASLTDQLTGLNNRRYLNSVVEQQCSAILRAFDVQLSKRNVNAENGPRLFFLMFDLDGFKPINDTYGHDAGDRVICQVGDLLKSVCRGSDTVIRWGGDEFLVMGRADDVQQIETLVERLRSKVSSYGFDIGLKQKMHLSCSIGFSMYPFSHHHPDALSWEQVHLLADKALYLSKESGKNQWTGLVQTVEMPPASVMNTFTQNIDNMMEQGYVRVRKTPQEKKSDNVTDISQQLNAKGVQ